MTQLQQYKSGDTIRTGGTVAQYWRPEVSNQGAWDALYVDGEELWYLQMTICIKHPVQQSYVLEILDACQPKPSIVKFIYVVPSLMYTTYEWQPWQTTKGIAVQQLTGEKKMVQLLVMDSTVRSVSDSSN
eukprot:jgi/Chrzof1/6229/Cz17g16160.t1